MRSIGGIYKNMNDVSFEEKIESRLFGNSFGCKEETREEIRKNNFGCLTFRIFKFSNFSDFDLFETSIFDVTVSRSTCDEVRRGTSN